MKPSKYLLLIPITLSVLILKGCNWPEPEIAPHYVNEEFTVKFYNNGDSTIQRMDLFVDLDGPSTWVSRSTGTHKEFSNNINSGWLLHPYDSLTVSLLGHPGVGVYIGCSRYVEFTIYDKDTTSASGYRLRGRYIVNEVIKQKYAEGERKYPDAEMIVNWPEDSLLFTNKQMMEQINLYPNPCYNEGINMRFPENITSLEVEVYSKSGKLVQSYSNIFVEVNESPCINGARLRFPDLPKGDYIFKIITPVGTYNQEVTIKDKVY